MKSKTTISVETWSQFRISRRPRQHLSFCERCDSETVALTAAEAATWSRESSRDLLCRIDSGTLHFINVDEETLGVCLNSLFKSLTSDLKSRF